MKLLATLLLIVGLGLTIPPSIMRIGFTRNCGGHLELAANSNTVATAEKELTIAIEYLERENLTSGYTSVLWQTPDEDIGFWYNNLKASLTELKTLSPDATPLEKSNMLIKLRETILSHGERGEYVTRPEGIHKYPNNGKWAFATALGAMLILVSIGIFFVDLHDL